MHFAEKRCQPEIVIATRPGPRTGDQILITNYGNEWIAGYDNRTGAQNAKLIGGKLIVRN